MQIRKITALGLSVCLAAGMSACGKDDGGAAGNKKPAVDISSLSDFSYSTLHYDYETKDGYQFDYDVTCSPWIPASDKELIESAWADLGCSGEIPYTIEDWHLHKVFNDMYGPESIYKSDKELFDVFATEMTDLYISVGKLHVKNKLEDWHVTPQSPVSMNFWLKEKEHSGKICSKVLYDNQAAFYADPANFLMSLDSDDDVTPFIMMFAELKNPKNPNGAYRELAEKVVLYPAMDEPGWFQQNQYQEDNTCSFSVYDRKGDTAGGAKADSES